MITSRHNGNTFKEELKKALEKELPGLEAQLRMVPGIRRQEIEKRKWDENAKKAAVLICFYPGSNSDIELAFIRRNEYDGVHSGQISFPGGRYEESDQDLIETALREAEEEVRILAEQVEILGEISPVYIPPSNFFVKPVVGWTDHKPSFVPDPSEVQEVLSFTVGEITDPANFHVRTIEHREYNLIDVPCFYVRGHIIWGATAMMLSEMIAVLDRIK